MFLLCVQRERLEDPCHSWCALFGVFVDMALFLLAAGKGSHRESICNGKLKGMRCSLKRLVVCVGVGVIGLWLLFYAASYYFSIRQKSILRYQIEQELSK